MHSYLERENDKLAQGNERLAEAADPGLSRLG
jgi:hypothetical protein